MRGPCKRCSSVSVCPLASKITTTNTQLNSVYSKPTEREREWVWTGNTDTQTHTHTQTHHTQSSIYASVILMYIHVCICNAPQCGIDDFLLTWPVTVRGRADGSLWVCVLCLKISACSVCVCYVCRCILYVCRYVCSVCVVTL